MSDEDTVADFPPSNVVVQLLDSGGSQVLKTWKFNGRRAITIGRDVEQDVEVSDPYVSRRHAELHWGDGRWLLISRGRNGVVVGDAMITELPVQGEVVFRLGGSGPTLRFRPWAARDSVLQTRFCESVPDDLLQIDRAKIEREVNDIAGGSYFHELKQKAQRLRRHREQQ